MNRRLVAFALSCLLVGCGRSPQADPEARSGARPAQHARSPAGRRAALRMRHARARVLLGDHRYQAVHRVRVTLDGQPDRSFTDRYTLRCRARRDCYGRQDNSLEYGVEFYRIGEQTWFRHRYQRFLRFSEEPEEAQRRAERIWGAGAAVVELLGNHLQLTPAGETTAAGRKARRYKLSLRAGAVQVHTGRRAWRSRMKARRIEGEALLDSKSGVPLALRVVYAVSAPKAGRTVTLAGTFDGRVDQAGRPQTIRPPAEFDIARSRPREDRQLRLLGSHRLNPGWFRAGGPHAARRRRAAGAMGPGARRPRPAPGMRRPRAPRPRPMARP